MPGDAEQQQQRTDHVRGDQHGDELPGDVQFVAVYSGELPSEVKKLIASP
ncbi:hypothetical protein [Streptomyces coeruleorubidus]